VAFLAGQYFAEEHMTVWVVVEETPYEGGGVVAVYATEESARSRASTANTSEPYDSYYRVSQYEVWP
jgi:hypothetical protein